MIIGEEEPKKIAIKPLNGAALIKCRTERYRLSFLPYSLAHYQDLS
jgi:hypothetical protein